jgi:hypothetical protein
MKELVDDQCTYVGAKRGGDPTNERGDTSQSSHECKSKGVEKGVAQRRNDCADWLENWYDDRWQWHKAGV